MHGLHVMQHGLGCELGLTAIALAVATLRTGCRTRAGVLQY